MNKLIIIAGPQSSGKSATLDYLNDHLPSPTVFLSEITPAMLTGTDHGHSVMKQSVQERIIIEDRKQLETRGHAPTTVVETGIFHCVYMEKAGGESTAQKYFKEYLAQYRAYESHVVFINTIPEISWQRRQPIYTQRVQGFSTEKQRIELFNYKKKIDDLYPLWLKYYKAIPFSKYMIDNNYYELDEFYRHVQTLVIKIIS